MGTFTHKYGDSQGLTLGELQEFLDSIKLPDNTMIAPGFSHPHSYRGDYSCPSFEPESQATLGDMKRDVAHALEGLFSGWKGGEYTFCHVDKVYLSPEGYSWDQMVDGPFLDSLTVVSG